MSETSEDETRIADWGVLGWTALFAFVALGLIFRGQDAAYHLNPAPIDGTLHLFNSLRRIAAGQRAGADFQVFHGVLLPYAYYPAFRIGGSSFFSAELARQVFTPLALIGGYVVIFAALTRSLRATIALSSIALLASLALPLNALVTPGASELGVRTVPVLVAVAAMTTSWFRDRRYLRAALEGALLGLTIAIATEQGLALVGAYALVRSIEVARSNDRGRRAAGLAIALLAAPATLLATLFVICGPRGMVAALAYNFGAVPQDQFWYFGALPSVSLVYWSQLFHPRIGPALLVSIANAVFWVSRMKRPRAAHPPRTFALALLAAYAPLACFPLLARWVAGYADVAIRVVIITTLYALHSGAAARALRRPITRLWPVFTAAILLIVATLSVPGMVAAILVSPWHVVTTHIVKREGLALAEDWRRTMGMGEIVVASRTRATGKRPTIWSTYSGPFDAVNDSFNPAFDYAIDALGKENRARYIDAFRQLRPDVVQTVSPVYTLFEEWMEDTRWDLYHELLANYRIAAVGPWSVFWERHPGPEVQSTALMEWVRQPGETRPVAGFRFTRSSGISLLEVEADYRIINPWHLVPVARDLSHFQIVINGALNTIPVPLSPYEHTVRFPVVVRNATSVVFGGYTESILPGASVRIDALRIRGMPLTPDTYEWAHLFAAASQQFRR
jgi:hypothetical protein